MLFGEGMFRKKKRQHSAPVKEVYAHHNLNWHEPGQITFNMYCRAKEEEGCRDRTLYVLCGCGKTMSICTRCGGEVTALDPDYIREVFAR